MDKIATEEDLEQVLQGLQNHGETSTSSQHEELPDQIKDSNPDESPLSTNETGILNNCKICDRTIDQNLDLIECTKCNEKMHFECGHHVARDVILCTLCERRQHLSEVRADIFKRQKVAAEKMVNFCEKKFPPLAVGDAIILAVPSVDRGPLDFANISGIINQKENDVYQIGTEHGLIKGWFPRTELQTIDDGNLKLNDIPKEVLLTLREAAAKQSLSGGQGFKRCKCKPSASQCKNKRCVCLKTGHICNSRCHPGSTCANHQ